MFPAGRSSVFCGENVTRRVVLFGLAVLSGPAVWLSAGDFAGVAGLAVLCAVALFAVPVVLLQLVSTPRRYWGPLLAGRRRRARYRTRMRERSGDLYREHSKSGAFPVWVKRAVLRVDRRCVACGSRDRMVADHFCPWAGGGLSVFVNAVGLCWDCNSVKCNYWPERDGYVYYRYKGNREMTARAKVIWECERRRRWDLLRWWRAAWVL